MPEASHGEGFPSPGQTGSRGAIAPLQSNRLHSTRDRKRHVHARSQSTQTNAAVRHCTDANSCQFIPTIIHSEGALQPYLQIPAYRSALSSLWGLLELMPRCVDRLILGVGNSWVVNGRL